MATTQALAARRGMVEARIAAASARIADRLGLPLPPPLPGQVARDPHVGPLARLEGIADLLEAVESALTTKTPPTPSKKGSTG